MQLLLRLQKKLKLSRLPEHIAPMLARIGQPFDDQDWLFEVKWDGVRALALVRSDGSIALRSSLIWSMVQPECPA